MADTVLAGPGTAATPQAGPGSSPRAPQRQPSPAPAAPVLPTRRPLTQAVGAGLVLLGVVLLGLAGYLYGLSGLQETRSQAVLYQRLQVELGQVNGAVAPLGPTAPGSPIAILNIPSIGVRDMVVVEGTSSEDLTLGPGHLRSTPYPGQGGVSEIFGRRATFGAPFGGIARLRPGAVVQAVTGQGTSIYRVVALAGSDKRIVDPAPNRLVLITASSPVIPSYYLQVDADLVSAVHNGPGVVAQITSAELPLAGDGGTLVLTTLWALALAIVAAGGTYAAIKWSAWPAYLAAAPLALAVLWNLYQGLSALLPNVY